MSFDGFQPAMGDRTSLTLDEHILLEQKVLPTARRWVRDIPGLADHGRQTLAYWGETPPPQPPHSRSNER